MPERVIVMLGSGIRPVPRLMRFFNGDPVLIAADGGAAFLRETGMRPHLIVGDLDSLPAGDLTFFESEGVPFRRYPREKDMTDAEIAIREALVVLHGQDSSRISDFPAMTLLTHAGGRIDHRTGHLFLLETIAGQGVTACLADEESEIFLALDGMPARPDRRAFLPDEPYISVLPLSERVRMGKCNGLRYELSGKELIRGSLIGLSNRFCGDRADIRVERGKLLVMVTRENGHV